METTWDGLPVAREPPFAACVVVWREGANGREFLVLHRLAPGGPEFEGEWAWTPPSGACFPGEEPDDAARRELYEETGLTLDIARAQAAAATEEVALYVARAAPGDTILLDAEHDRFEWLPLDEALGRCLPPVVADGLANAAAWLDAVDGNARDPLHNRRRLGTQPRANPR